MWKKKSLGDAVSKPAAPVPAMPTQKTWRSPQWPQEGLVAAARGLPYERLASPWAYLEADLHTRLTECTLTAEDKAFINQAIIELRAAVGSLGDCWHSTLFGSVANGFGTRTSDIDVTCLKARPDREGEDAAKDLERLGPLLRAHPKFAVVEEVFRAKVPIMKLRYGELLDIDLSCHNSQAVRNTLLLRAYANLDRRVRELGVAVKLWAKGAGVCGAFQGHLSSYSFTLLAIYFMQVDPEVCLPCLPTCCNSPLLGQTAKGARGDVDSDSAAAQEKIQQEDLDEALQRARASWRCRFSTAELLIRFFLFYDRWFAWGHEVVCPRLGQRLFAGTQAFEQLRGRWAQRIHIEDPIVNERNLHCVLGDMEEVRLRKAFAEAMRSLDQGLTPVGLRPAAAMDEHRTESSETCEEGANIGEAHKNGGQKDATEIKEEGGAADGRALLKSTETERFGTWSYSSAASTASIGGDQPHGYSTECSGLGESSQESNGNSDTESPFAATPESTEWVVAWEKEPGSIWKHGRGGAMMPGAEGAEDARAKASEATERAHWWRNLDSISTMKGQQETCYGAGPASKSSSEVREGRSKAMQWLTVQEFEGNISGPPNRNNDSAAAWLGCAPQMTSSPSRRMGSLGSPVSGGLSFRRDEPSPSPSLPRGRFRAAATRKIAARVSKACLAGRGEAVVC
jgi:DNA polymerase sigma